MIEKYVTYTVQKDQVDAVKEAIAVLVAGIEEHEPGTWVYETWQESDEVSFIHMMVFEDEDAEEAHKEAANTKTFVEFIYPKCDKEPLFHDIEEISGVRRDY